MKKKLISLLLVICMVVGMLPVIALAAEGENFCIEYWDGNAFGCTSVAPGETAYLAQEDAGDGCSRLFETDDTVNYVVKIENVNGEFNVYFNGLDAVNPATRGILFERYPAAGYEGWVTGADVNLIIEKDSYFEVRDNSYYGAIEAYSTGTFTISSVDGAKLTVNGKGYLISIHCIITTHNGMFRARTTKCNRFFCTITIIHLFQIRNRWNGSCI